MNISIQRYEDSHLVWECSITPEPDINDPECPHAWVLFVQRDPSMSPTLWVRVATIDEKGVAGHSYVPHGGWTVALAAGLTSR